MNICSVEGCGKKAYTRTWCRTHYSRWIRTGDPTKLRRKPAKVLYHKGYAIFQHKPVHIANAEKALGKPLPEKAVVHHVDGNPANNANSNLVICQDHTYHMLLHRRARALKECGDPNKRICVYCNKWDDPYNLYFPPGQFSGRHKACQAEYDRQLYQRKKEKANGTTQLSDA